jgi:hypothetical protein
MDFSRVSEGGLEHAGQESAGANLAAICPTCSKCSSRCPSSVDLSHRAGCDVLWLKLDGNCSGVFCHST